jgi:hypothetical protein
MPLLTNDIHPQNLVRELESVNERHNALSAISPCFHNVIRHIIEETHAILSTTSIEGLIIAISKGNPVDLTCRS